MNILRYLALLLLAIVRPRVEGDDHTLDLDLQGGEGEGESETQTEGVEGETETQTQTETEGEQPKVDRAAIEREVSEKYERQLAELRAAQPIRPTADPIFEQEEARLKASDATDLEKWQIQANRQLRAGAQASSAALAQAYDVADRTAFATLATTEPTLYKKYSPIVEQKLAEERSKGRNARREDIYTYLLGKDMREGKFTKKKAGAQKTNDANLQRGKLPGARSDVSGKNSMSDREKRAARLENVEI